MIGNMKALRDVNRWWKKTEAAMNLQAELLKADVDKNDLAGPVLGSGPESGGATRCQRYAGLSHI